MAFDPSRWTIKTQEAFNGALEAARAASHPEVVPEHLLVSLLTQADGVVVPLLQKVGIDPRALRAKAADVPQQIGCAVACSLDEAKALHGRLNQLRENLGRATG